MLSELEKTAFPYGKNAPRVDPSGLPEAWVLSLKATSVTEVTLLRLMRAERLTFLGEAACLILDYIAHHPERADVSLRHSGQRPNGAQVYAFKSGLFVPRAILTPMTQTALAFVGDITRTSGQSLTWTASRLLHLNAKHICDRICALRLET